MRELVCITCPMGCHLSVTLPDNAEGASAPTASPAGITVTGNRCPRGLAYAAEELFSPRRSVTATCPVLLAPESGATTSGCGRIAPVLVPRRLPVRSRSPFPRERVPQLLTLIHTTTVSPPVRMGQVILPDALGSGIDIIATRSLSAQS